MSLRDKHILPCVASDADAGDLLSMLTWQAPCLRVHLPSPELLSVPHRKRIDSGSFLLLPMHSGELEMRSRY